METKTPHIDTDIAFKKADKTVLPNRKTAINFGYSINHDRQLDYDALSRSMYNYIVSKEPSVKACISCGTCAATCSAAQFTNFSLRRMILLARRGEVKDLVKTSQSCMLCGKCQILCPMGVNTRNLLLTIQEFTTTE